MKRTRSQVAVACGRIATVWVVGVCCGLADVGGAASAAEPQTLLKETFENGADAWSPTDPAAWKLEETPSGKVFSQFQQSKFKPPHRSPFNFALNKDVLVGDFVLEAKVKSTTREYGHRDACVVFGYQDPAHFYYVHLGRKTDDHANQIFIVKDAPRVKISTRTSEGTPWTDGWHKVKVVRKVSGDSIHVYFDDMEKPVMEATDASFAWGQVGIGSFDDTTQWDDVVVTGVPAERPGAK